MSTMVDTIFLEVLKNRKPAMSMTMRVCVQLLTGVEPVTSSLPRTGSVSFYNHENRTIKGILRFLTFELYSNLQQLYQKAYLTCHEILFVIYLKEN
jgi:hypothetical protein